MATWTADTDHFTVDEDSGNHTADGFHEHISVSATILTGLSGAVVVGSVFSFGVNLPSQDPNYVHTTPGQMPLLTEIVPIQSPGFVEINSGTPDAWSVTNITQDADYGCSGPTQLAAWSEGYLKN